jgi:hypothetical protein
LSRTTRGCEILFPVWEIGRGNYPNAYQDAALSKTRVYDWFSHFKNGEMSIDAPQRQELMKTSTKSMSLFVKTVAEPLINSVRCREKD